MITQNAIVGWNCKEVLLQKLRADIEPKALYLMLPSPNRGERKMGYCFIERLP